jgi:uncharacterized protein YyaL (SSP411 family)
MHMTLTLALALTAPTAPAPIAWQDWSEKAFAQAARERRLVLLDLGAVWCHWCHVMDETTYRDPEVVQLLKEHFVPVHVDQDAHPDLANRYEDYGWPATIVFDSSGGELVRFRGYIEPPRMRSLLRALVEDPTPGPSVTAAAGSPDAAHGTFAHGTTALRQELEALQVERYDGERGGWGFVHKYLDADSIEHALLRARQGDAGAERRARETLGRARALFDPVWGGVYQYSDSGVWSNPHFEKIMSFQAGYLRAYSLAYAQWRDPDHLAAAREVHRYLRAFLRSPEGAFYVSQDADVVPGRHSAGYFALPDAERRRQGLPRVDTHLYARENGWAVQGLVALHQAGGDVLALDDALTAARWIVANRSLPGGGFAHGAADTAGPFLADTLAAAKGFLALYAATGEREWLRRAEDAAAFIDRTFRRGGRPGYVTAAGSKGGPLGEARPQREENVQVGRLAAALERETERASYREMARLALGYVSIPEVARRFSTAGPLLLMDELEAPTRVSHSGPAAK